MASPRSLAVKVASSSLLMSEINPCGAEGAAVGRCKLDVILVRCVVWFAWEWEYL